MALLSHHKLYPRLKDIPHRAGVYLFKDIHSKVLYVGKAKNLHSRVKSYFQGFSRLTNAKKRMIESAEQIDYIIAANEIEALLLENKAIKEYRPLYNIVWKDDKSYLYLFIDWSEPFPRLQIARRLENAPKKRKGTIDYFGPYPSASDVRRTIKALHRIFPFRTCDRDLRTLPNGRVCLLYHMGQCSGPCEAKTTREEYENMMHRLADFLRGDIDYLVEKIKADMQKAALSRNFEAAARLRDQLRSFEKFSFHQKVAEQRGVSHDVFNISRGKNNECVVNMLMIRFGYLARRQQWHLSIPPETPDEEILSSFAGQYYASVPSAQRPHEALFPVRWKNMHELYAAYGVKARVPEKGEKQKLLTLGLLNAETYWHTHSESSSSPSPREVVETLWDELRNAGMKLSPLTPTSARFECFDISHQSGTNQRGSMVVFIDGKSVRSLYRLFKINGITKPDDFFAHAHVMRRRIARTKNPPSGQNAWPHPDLLIIDGGAGQVEAVHKELRAANVQWPVIGIAKEREEIYIPRELTNSLHEHPKSIRQSIYQNFIVLRLGLDHPATQLVQRMRDEAHRFGIAASRKSHEKQSLRSPFDQIPGIGAVRKRALKARYGSLQEVIKRPIAELASVIGEKAARNLQEWIVHNSP